MSENYRAIAQTLFEKIRTEFGELEASFSGDGSNVSIALHFRAQAHLPFDVNLALQDDELHLYIGPLFHVEWFPCSVSARVNEFAAAARGILSGEMRVVETRKRGVGVEAQLQAPVGSGWERVARWGELINPTFFFRAEQRVLQR